jgi:hypothetical protein
MVTLSLSNITPPHRRGDVIYSATSYAKTHFLFFVGHATQFTIDKFNSTVNNPEAVGWEFIIVNKIFFYLLAFITCQLTGSRD